MAVSKVILCGDISVPEGKLCEAARSGDLELVMKLVENGEDINQVDVNGETALIIASSLGHAEVSHYILDEGSIHTLYIFFR